MPDATPQLRVLVIDDSADNAEALGALIATMNCQTHIALSGREGVLAAARLDPQLIFIDLEMPGMDGCEVARYLRHARTPNPAKLVCLTGRGQPDDRRLCLDAGFDDFYTKPMPPDTLARVVAASHAAR
jgi:CheY-like chemotaxis protein